MHDVGNFTKNTRPFELVVFTGCTLTNMQRKKVMYTQNKSQCRKKTTKNACHAITHLNDLGTMGPRCTRSWEGLADEVGITVGSVGGL